MAALVSTDVPAIARTLAARVQNPVLTVTTDGFTCTGLLEEVECSISLSAERSRLTMAPHTILVIADERQELGQISIHHGVDDSVDRALHSWVEDELALDHELRPTIEPRVDSDRPSGLEIAYAGESDMEMTFAIVALIRKVVHTDVWRGGQ